MKINYRLAILEVFAIAVCYMIVAWPLASATSVNIFFNGQSQETAELSIGNLLNKQITSKHEPSDVTWTNVKILAEISSASLSHTIEKIYLYKCKKMSPINCIMTEPQVFDNWIDTELAWKDINEREGSGAYPQVANLLIIIKMIGPNGRTNWAGSWDTVRRTDYNVFNTYSHEISGLDFYAKSADLVQPIKSYIEGYQMIPFNWAEKVVLQGASSLYGLGGSESDLQSPPPQLQTAQPNTNEIDTINKDYYFLLSQTSSGIASPVTLNLNPSFDCGDGVCEIDLGETKESCCIDCGCLADEYCDVAGTGTSTCKDADAIAIQVQPLTTPTVTDCSLPFDIDLKLTINNPPSSLTDTLTAYMTLNDEIHTSTCTKGLGAEYTCPVTMTPAMLCGSGSSLIGPNTANVTISYNDGPNVISQDLSASFPDLTVTYDCACQSGFYCDAGERRCKPEGSVGLQILNVTSYMINYNPAGDNIIVTAKITNPPSDLTTPGTANYVLGSLYKGGSLIVNGTSGNAQCTGGSSTNHIYTCSIPISITNYDHENAYYYRGNSMTITATYSNGGTQAVKGLSAAISDVTIPSYRCGDGTQNAEETEENCCVDAGCSGTGKYCDAVSGCQYVNNVTLSMISVQPKNTTDCKRINTINLTAKVSNVPYDLHVNYVYYYKGGELQNWGLQCSTPNPVTGLSDCQLQIPPIDGCELPYYTVGPNSLNMTITFPDGLSSMITRHLSTSFDNILVAPTWHCGQYGCETGVGESGENCCIDCGCVDGEYCDYDPMYNPNGQCRAKQDIRLVIDDPSAQVSLDTCEKSHTVDVRAHIENQPSGMMLENWYGTINGESTEKLACQEHQRFSTSVNSTFECKVIVPAVMECSKGDTFNYANNSLSFFISYTDGTGRRVTQTLTSSMPAIKITQSIRSVYDITQDAISAMQAKLADTMSAMQDLLDIMQTCIKLAMVMAIVGVVATLAIGFGGDKLPGTLGKKLSGTTMGDRFIAGSMLTNALTTSVTSICDMISQYYQLTMKMNEAEMEMIQMQMCLDLHQHEMDIGNCDGREESCFSSITSCMRWNEIQNAMGDIGRFSSNINRDAARMTNAWTEFGEGLDDAGIGYGAGGRGSASLVVSCGGNDNTERCCDFEATPTTSNSGSGVNKDYNDYQVRVLGQINCEYPVVYKNGQPFLEGKTSSSTTSLHGFSSPTIWKFQLYCFKSSQQYQNARQPPSSIEDYGRGEKSFFIGHNNDSENGCVGSEWPSGTRNPNVPSGRGLTDDDADQDSSQNVYLCFTGTSGDTYTYKCGSCSETDHLYGSVAYESITKCESDLQNEADFMNYLYSEYEATVQGNELLVTELTESPEELSNIEDEYTCYQTTGQFCYQGQTPEDCSEIYGMYSYEYETCPPGAVCCGGSIPPEPEPAQDVYLCRRGHSSGITDTYECDESCDSGNIVNPALFEYDSIAECKLNLAYAASAIEDSMPGFLATVVGDTIQITQINQAPTATITKVGLHDVPYDDYTIENEVSGVVTITGTASDLNGIDDIEEVRVRAIHGVTADLDTYPSFDDEGNWQVEWDIAGNPIIQDGWEYSIIVIVTDDDGEFNNEFNTAVTVSKA